MRVRLSIDGGNAAMDEPRQAAQAIREVAEKIDQGRLEGPIIDVNGKTVGDYQVEAG